MEIKNLTSILNDYDLILKKSEKLKNDKNNLLNDLSELNEEILKNASLEELLELRRYLNEDAGEHWNLTGTIISVLKMCEATINNKMDDIQDCIYYPELAYIKTLSQKEQISLDKFFKGNVVIYKDRISSNKIKMKKESFNDVALENDTNFDALVKILWNLGIIDIENQITLKCSCGNNTVLYTPERQILAYKKILNIKGFVTDHQCECCGQHITVSYTGIVSSYENNSLKKYITVVKAPDSIERYIELVKEYILELSPKQIMGCTLEQVLLLQKLLIEYKSNNILMEKSIIDSRLEACYNRIKYFNS